MSNIRSNGSKIEKRIAKFLRKKRVKYKTTIRTLPGKPDFYLKDYNSVLFVDSCFWHGCRYHGTQPKSNSVFWKKKITRNKERDKEINKLYRKTGVHYLRIWEHSINTKESEKELDKRLDEFLKK